MKISALFKAYVLLGGVRVIPFLPNVFILWLTTIFSLVNSPEFRSYVFTKLPIFYWIALSSGIIGSLLSGNPILSSLYTIALLFAFPQILYIVPRYTFKKLLELLTLFTYANATLCTIQFFIKNFSIEPFLFGAKSSPTLLGFIPNMSRLPGLFIENGPMVNALIIVNEFFLFHWRTAKKPSLRIYLSLLINICLILFTGSKLALIYFPYIVLIITLQIIKKSNLKLKILIASPGLPWKLIVKLGAIMLIVSGILFFTNIEFFLPSNYLTYIKSMQAMTTRLEVPDITLFSISGLASSKDLGALNGFLLYLVAYGWFFGSIFIISMYLLLLSPFTTPGLSFAFLVSFMSSGSFSIYNYPLLLLCNKAISIAIKNKSSRI
ncbi:putative membrane protein [Synechococcus sp. MEDNS5]|uniref:hypothetical protein n=1 Tax=Synechococcus sp. MEDNS5 TaxID=1442554 RepID=UPI00164726A7|nr:hypothetical protein [Synechococcus sp. MEDNS5]QNJ04965.1 putative membrane protein [Synechococcus sp. MEDNS5]